MEAFGDLLLEVWREACRHIEIGESVSLGAPALFSGLPVDLVDERYSSVEVESRMRATYGARKAVDLARGKALDSQAAQLILEQYFDAKRAA